MLIFSIIFSVFIVAILLIGYYFFSIAFVKHNLGDSENINDPINAHLEKYKDIISKGIVFINSEPYREVFISSFDGKKLAAKYFYYGKDKSIILMHGYRSSASRDFSCAVGMYKAFGFNVLLCDQRSHGKSEGILITFGIKESYDVKLWADFLTEKFSQKNIVLGGMSMGSSTVLLSLDHKLPDTVKAVIADCGFTSAREIIEIVGKRKFKINPRPILPLLNLYCLVFGRFSLFSKTCVDTVKSAKIPVLLIHGKDDGFVPFEMSQQIYNANKNIKLLLVDGADHGLSYLIDRKMVEGTIKEFLKNNNLY